MLLFSYLTCYLFFCRYINICNYYYFNLCYHHFPPKECTFCFFRTYSVYDILQGVLSVRLFTNALFN